MADLDALRIFARVVEARGFTAAARRLAMPVSTVSRRVAELEADLGLRLLDRSTRGVRLSEEGARIIGLARALVDIDESLDDLLARDRIGARETVRLSAPPSISDTVLAPLVTEFQAAFPGIRIKVFIVGLITDAIAEDVDLALRVGCRWDDRLVRHRLISYRHRLVASPGYLASAAPLSMPRDLLAHPLLAFAFPGGENSWTLSKVGGGETESLRFTPHLALGDFGLTAVMLAGGGVGDLPPIVQPDLVREGRLVEVLPDWRLPVLDLCLVHPPARKPSGPTRLFADFAGARLPALFPDLPT